MYFLMKNYPPLGFNLFNSQILISMQENFIFSDSNNISKESSASVMSQVAEYSRSFFWFAADEYFQSTLYISPARQDAHNQHQIKIYDIDGQLTNQLNVKFVHGLPGLVELDGLVSNCKLQAGIRQGSVEVVSAAGTAHSCEINTSNRELTVSPVCKLSREKAGFFPLHLSTKSQNMIALNSLGQSDSMLKVRLYTGTRSPELEIKIKAFGAENLIIEEEFAEYLELDPHHDQQAYLRIVSYTSNDLSVRLLEQKYSRTNFTQQVME